MLGLMRGTVRLAPHEEVWEHAAKETIAELRLLCPEAVEIEHVGSTAIRGIHAKPVLDLTVAVRDLADAEGWQAALEAAGYRFCGSDQPNQLLFTKGEGEERTHHVHVVLWNGPAWHNYRNFRDYLNTHPERAAAYDALKQTLAAQYADDRKTYTAQKTSLIDELLEEARRWRKKQIIHIFGASGSGTSTLGRKICEELGYTFLDTDDYFWLPTDPKFTTPRPVEERLRLMRREIEQADNVVISGSLVDWGDELIPLFTLAVRIEMDPEVRIERLRARERARFGERLDPGGDMYQQHLAFVQWARAYDTGGLDMRSKARHDQWQKLLTCPLIEVDGAADLEDNYLVVKQILKQEAPMNWKPEALVWTREPKQYTISADRIEIVTEPHTDLWQRTYYHFRNDNAPVLQMETEERFFFFTVKTEFDSKHRFDQCGVVLYLDSENWIKASIEFENQRFQHLGSVVTNHGYSDWATTEIGADIKAMWYRLSRREDDYCIECSEDGETFRQMRVCHLWEGGGAIRFGVYACSPEESSFQATFTHMEVTECRWLAHDGQQPDE